MAVGRLPQSVSRYTGYSATSVMRKGKEKCPSMSCRSFLPRTSMRQAWSVGETAVKIQVLLFSRNTLVVEGHAVEVETPK